MKIISLYDLHERNDDVSHEKLKRLREIILLDPAVTLALRVSDLDDLWEYDFNLIKNMDLISKGVLRVDSHFGRRVEGLKCCHKSEDIDNYLVLHPSVLEGLLKLDGVVEPVFSSIIKMTKSESVEEIDPEGDSERVFVFCHPGKRSDEFDGYDGIPFHWSILDLCVDVISTEYKEELIDILPNLAEYPSFIQEKMVRVPHKYSNRPERLECLIDAYKKYWVKVKTDKSLDIDKKAINQKVGSYIKSSFIERSKLYNEARGSENQIKFGDKISDFSIKLIEPDFLDAKKRMKRPSSYGVPEKLWVLICAAQYFWKGVDRDDIEKHPQGTHIERVLRCIGNEFPFKKDIFREGKGEVAVLLESAMQDCQRFMRQFPEIRYFSDINFNSDYKHAASIIRPLWANSKSEGGPYGSAMPEDEKIRINIVTEKKH